MAKKKKVEEEPEIVKAKSLLSLEKSDHAAFVRELHLLGVKAEGWDLFKKVLANEVKRARTNSQPFLTPIKLAKKMGTNVVNIHTWETSKKQPMLFNLWLLAEQCGKRLKIVIE